MDPRSIDRDVTGAAASHQRLLAHLDELLADGFDPAVPSHLPDWSVGHVLTHLARNADSFTGVIGALGRGENTPQQYPSGEARNADIEAGAGRPATVLVDDVRSSIWRLEAAWSQLGDWTGHFAAGGGGHGRPVAELPYRRWCEVEVHHADLGLGYEFADWPSDFVRLELRRLEMQWSARRPMGATRLPDAVLATPPNERLAWMFGRLDIAGVQPAGLL
jgi:maleylpyruvate isomerase